jgi:hypothetical protein
MKVGDDHFAIVLAGESITLRPTLRCGMRLDRRAGSFAKLIDDLNEGSLSAATFVLSPHFERLTLGFLIIESGLESVCTKLIPFVLECAGIDPDAQGEGGEGAVPFSEHLRHLYRIATGWIGWTPETALDCTPGEITEAYKGRLEMLKAIFGGEDANAKPRDLNSKIRQIFGDIGTKVVSRRKPDA